MDYVPLPRFSSEKLSIWFAQVESAFTLNGVISESDKYDYVITHIPLEYSTMMEDIILNPPVEEKYEYFKYEFIKRMSVYQLKNEDLGSKKPSEYLQRLKKLADQRVPIEMILNVWLNNLPKRVREIVSLESSGNVDILCEMADKVMALVNQTTPSSLDLSGDQFGLIVNRIDELSKQVRTIQMKINGEDLQQPVQPRTYTVPIVSGIAREVPANVPKVGSTDTPKVICWYHSVYGERAVACIAPCQYIVPQGRYYVRQ